MKAGDIIPRQRRVAAAAGRTVLQAPAVSGASPPSRAESRDVLQRGRNIDLMEHPELKLYARQIGIKQQDVDGLTVDRLRQNCKARLYEYIESF